MLHTHLISFAVFLVPSRGGPRCWFRMRARKILDEFDENEHQANTKPQLTTHTLTTHLEAINFASGYCTLQIDLVQLKDLPYNFEQQTQ